MFTQHMCHSCSYSCTIVSSSFVLRKISHVVDIVHCLTFLSNYRCEGFDSLIDQCQDCDLLEYNTMWFGAWVPVVVPWRWRWQFAGFSKTVAPLYQTPWHHIIYLVSLVHFLMLPICHHILPSDSGFQIFLSRPSYSLSRSFWHHKGQFTLIGLDCDFTQSMSPWTVFKVISECYCLMQHSCCTVPYVWIEIWRSVCVTWAARSVGSLCVTGAAQSTVAFSGYYADFRPRP